MRFLNESSSKLRAVSQFKAFGLSNHFLIHLLTGLNVLREALIDELMDAVTASQYLAHKVTTNLKKTFAILT
jgi:hypothetical protein